MKRTGIVLLVLTPFLFGACAASKPAPAAAPAPTATSAATPSKSDQYRQVVENKAQKSGARVTWVHQPDEDDLVNKFNAQNAAVIPTN